MVETIVVIGVTAFLALAVTNMTIALSRFTGREEILGETQRHAILGIEPIRTAALAASGIEASRTILGVVYATGEDAVVLAVPTVDAAGALVASSTDYIAFARAAATPTKLIRATEAAAGSRLQTRVDTIIPLVSSFRIRYATSAWAAADSFEISLETEDTVLGFTQRTPMTTVITLGNK